MKVRSHIAAEPPALTSIVPAKDEALHIARCIESVIDLGPVFVVDGGSADDTRAIAEAHGAKTIEHAWDGYADQKNWALENLPIDTPWVLFLDADEYVTPSLRSEIEEAITRENVVGLYLARENIVLGRLLKHAWWYPDYQMRVFRLGKARFEDRLVHEHVIVDGPTDVLRGALVHENLKGVSAWMDRHIRYAALEAVEMRSRAHQGSAIPPRFLGSRAERRRALKTRVWYRLPFRPAIRFFWLYLVRRGFLDGRPGLVYCQLVAAYEALIDANLLEMELNEKERRN